MKLVIQYGDTHEEIRTQPELDEALIIIPLPKYMPTCPWKHKISPGSISLMLAIVVHFEVGQTADVM
jgi:hypothetical protein